MPLKKATLQEIKADASAAPLGPELEVQFNPASLKLELANKVEGGDTKGRQSRQYLGKTSTTLSFDLHFDTADEGTPDAPVSVRTRTAAVEAFVLPKGSGNTKQAPPKARFHWDDLVIDGIIESLAIDFDLFAANGTPLRAKMSVSIKEQDAKYQLLQTGPGANQPIEGAPDRTAEALDGESAADFAVRMGLDASAWRGIAAQLGAASSLSLSAGLSIDFNASLSASAGIGLSAGIEASAGASLGASFGLEAGASASASISAGVSAGVSAGISAGGSAGASAGASRSAGGSMPATAGLALAAAGGVTAAIETVTSVQATSAASSARRSFGSADVPPPTATPRPALPEQRRTPLQTRGTTRQLPSASAQTAAPAAPAPPRADRRATSFGYGVPLRPQATRAGGVSDRDPSAPPWTQTTGGADRRVADRAQARRQPAHRCGCAGRCHHGA